MRRKAWGATRRWWRGSAASCRAGSAAGAARLLQPYAGEFLYTHVDREGMMQGTDMAAIEAVRQATTRALTAAGGITTQEEVDALDQRGIDAVVGMALYTGRLTLPPGSRLKTQG